MSTDRYDGATVTTRANVYFDGKCVSHSIVTADGRRRAWA